MENNIKSRQMGGAFINPENLNSNIYSQNYPPPNPLLNSQKGF